MPPRVALCRALRERFGAEPRRPDHRHPRPTVARGPDRPRDRGGGHPGTRRPARDRRLERPAPRRDGRRRRRRDRGRRRPRQGQDERGAGRGRARARPPRDRTGCARRPGDHPPARAGPVPSSAPARRGTRATRPACVRAGTSARHRCAGPSSSRSRAARWRRAVSGATTASNSPRPSRSTPSPRRPKPARTWSSSRPRPGPSAGAELIPDPGTGLMDAVRAGIRGRPGPVAVLLGDHPRSRACRALREALDRPPHPTSSRSSRTPRRHRHGARDGSRRTRSPARVQAGFGRRAPRRSATCHSKVPGRVCGAMSTCSSTSTTCSALGPLTTAFLRGSPSARRARSPRGPPPSTARSSRIHSGTAAARSVRRLSVEQRIRVDGVDQPPVEHTVRRSRPVQQPDGLRRGLDADRAEAGVGHSAHDRAADDGGDADDRRAGGAEGIARAVHLQDRADRHHGVRGATSSNT